MHPKTSALCAIQLLALWFFLPTTAMAGNCPSTVPDATGRFTVVISDLHFGVGRDKDGAWDPTEDFRWSNALQGFVDRISSCGHDAVDLVIDGDFLELWQPPKGIACKGANDDTACTLVEAEALVRLVVQQHAADLKALGRFADKGTNRLVVIPGNHDAALMLDGLWSIVSEAMATKSNRVERVSRGLWVSSDGRLLVEHGHQIGKDVNRFDAWPSVTRQVGAETYLVRPWGELFVQDLFNEQEREYSIIDNLSPESAGARYRMADRGLWKSVSDVARFVQFNLFETSLRQKALALGKTDDPKLPPPWDLVLARARGYQLFSLALPADDPFVKSLLDTSNEKSGELRESLTALARDAEKLPDADVKLLCDQIAIVSGPEHLCVKAPLGSLVQTLLMSKRAVIAKHLNDRIGTEKLAYMRVFVYAHTHQLEEEWTVDPRPGRRVHVYNTGAFQRLVSEEGFLKRARREDLSPAQALKKLTVKSLAPCYSAVVVALGPVVPSAKTEVWLMDEDGTGEFTSPKDARCL